MPLLRELRTTELAKQGTGDTRGGLGTPSRLGVRLLLGTGILGLLVVLGLVAPIVYPISGNFSPLHLDLNSTNLQPGVNGHFFGTDYLGRDVLSQAVWGARSTLSVGILAAMIAVTFGSLWGSFSAFAGGIVDSVMMRIVDGLLAIPNIILLLALNSILSTPALVQSLPPPVVEVLGVNNYSYGLIPLLLVITVISATSWLEAARVARAKVLALLSEEYLLAASSLGAGTMAILLKHLLPNAASVLLVEATLLVSDAVLMESGLSFLGLGLGPNTPSWGTMLSAAQLCLLEGNWWSVFIPGVLITITVSAISLLGDGLLELMGQSNSATI
jgi:ABC-type dipeptide/oligopeptide/nickel transport system permease subunit